MEFSFDGTTWTAATETITLAGGFIATPSGANLRARVWAINSIARNQSPHFLTAVDATNIKAPF